MKQEIIDDDIFGQLKFEKDSDLWSGRIDMPPFENIEILINIIEKPSEIETILPKAKKVFAIIKEKEKKIAEKAYENLKKDYEDEWSEGNPVSKAEFIDKMWLETIAFDCDGKAEMFYDAGGLFTDHGISVCVNKNGKVTEVDLS